MQKSTSNATVGVTPAVEYLGLALKLAKQRGLKSIPIPVEIAQSVLDLALNPPQESIPYGSPGDYSRPSPVESPPPLEVTSVSFQEEQQRTRPMRQSTFSGPWAGDYSLNRDTRPSRNVMRDAGRGWHRGM